MRERWQNEGGAGMVFPERKIVEKIRREYPAGCEVVLDRMDEMLSRILDKQSYQDL